MIPLLVLAAATIFDTPGGDAARFDACVRLIRSDPLAAREQADAWAANSSGVPARQCQGLAFVANGRWEPAALTFEAAARDAEIARDGRAASLWTQAGNAALAGDDAARARADLDHALALPTLSEPMRGEAWIDRARADVALNDPATGRADLDRGIGLVPRDPFVWLLSATLARRESDLVRADRDIQEAARLAPDAAAVALEAGNIAAARGALDAAKLAWTRAAQLAPTTPEGKAAIAALAADQPGG